MCILVECGHCFMSSCLHHQYKNKVIQHDPTSSGWFLVSLALPPVLLLSSAASASSIICMNFISLSKFLSINLSDQTKLDHFSFRFGVCQTSSFNFVAIKLMCAKLNSIKSTCVAGVAMTSQVLAACIAQHRKT